MIADACMCSEQQNVPALSCGGLYHCLLVEASPWASSSTRSLVWFKVGSYRHDLQCRQGRVRSAVLGVF